MTKLNQTQLKTIGQMLAQRGQELQAEVRASEAIEPERPAADKPEVGDVVDVGDANFRIGIEHAERQRDKEELLAIDTARRRIADGSYGTCTDCGGSIPIARLLAQPTATRCIACQAAYERHHPSVPHYTP